jgi:hypothetical protein
MDGNLYTTELGDIYHHQPKLFFVIVFFAVLCNGVRTSEGKPFYSTPREICYAIDCCNKISIHDIDESKRKESWLFP